MTHVSYTPHRYAQIFPRRPQSDIIKYLENASPDELSRPVLVFEGAILEGDHRRNEMHARYADVQYEEFDGTHAAALAVVLKDHAGRDDLNLGQRAATEVLYYNLVEEIDQSGYQGDIPETGLLVSPTAVQQASELLHKAPRLAYAVHRGELTLSKAMNELKCGELQDRVGWFPPCKISVVLADLSRDNLEDLLAIGPAVASQLSQISTLVLAVPFRDLTDGLKVVRALGYRLVTSTICGITDAVGEETHELVLVGENHDFGCHHSYHTSIEADTATREQALAQFAEKFRMSKDMVALCTGALEGWISWPPPQADDDADHVGRPFHGMATSDRSSRPTGKKVKEVLPPGCTDQVDELELT